MEHTNVTHIHNLIDKSITVYCNGDAIMTFPDNITNINVKFATSGDSGTIIPIVSGVDKTTKKPTSLHIKQNLSSLLLKYPNDEDKIKEIYDATAKYCNKKLDIVSEEVESPTGSNSSGTTSSKKPETDHSEPAPVVDRYKNVDEFSKGDVYSTTKTLTNISQLVYPKDIIDSGDLSHNNYNGCYTVFFISEVVGSTIGKEAANKGCTYTMTEEDDRRGSQQYDTLHHNESGMSARELQQKTTMGVATLVGLRSAWKGGKRAKALSDSHVDKMIQTVGGNVGSMTKSMIAAVPTTAGALLSGITGGGLTYMGIDFITSRGGESKGNIAFENSALAHLKSAIVLPTPVIEDNHTLSWEEENTAIGSFIMDKLKNFGDGSWDGVPKSLTEESTTDFITSTSLAVGGQLGAGGALSRALAITQNTRKELLFKDVGMREFTMNYNLVARSADEMRSIESIIRVFKYHSYPEVSNTKVLFIYPAQFDIVHYHNGDINPHMPKHASCVLDRISISYGDGEQLDVHEGGAPVIIKLSLHFKELAVLNKKAIAQGY